DQLTESIGVVLNMIGANMRTEELLQQSQGLTQELQTQSKELTVQQEELKRSNAALEKQALELEEKAKQLEEQNASIEVKNREVELARASLEEKAEQLSLISKYKSEFLANMSHELRTPLNSLLILAKLLADNKDANLSEKQVEYAKTIYASGGDLLTLINEILDLSKVEAGKMQIEPRDIALTDLRDYFARTFRSAARPTCGASRPRAAPSPSTCPTRTSPPRRRSSPTPSCAPAPASPKRSRLEKASRRRRRGSPRVRSQPISLPSWRPASPTRWSRVQSRTIASTCAKATACC